MILMAIIQNGMKTQYIPDNNSISRIKKSRSFPGKRLLFYAVETRLIASLQIIALCFFLLPPGEVGRGLYSSWAASSTSRIFFQQRQRWYHVRKWQPHRHRTSIDNPAQEFLEISDFGLSKFQIHRFPSSTTLFSWNEKLR